MSVSHCLLNQNVRYLGGAACPGVVPATVDAFIRNGTGLYQMPCPEQAAWGGVLKRYVLRFYGSDLRLRADIGIPAAEVFLSPVHGLSDTELVDGARRSTMDEIARVTVKADRVLVF